MLLQTYFLEVRLAAKKKRRNFFCSRFQSSLRKIYSKNYDAFAVFNKKFKQKKATETSCPVAPLP